MINTKNIQLVDVFRRQENKAKNFKYTYQFYMHSKKKGVEAENAPLLTKYIYINASTSCKVFGRNDKQGKWWRPPGSPKKKKSLRKYIQGVEKGSKNISERRVRFHVFALRGYHCGMAYWLQHRPVWVAAVEGEMAVAIIAVCVTWHQDVDDLTSEGWGDSSGGWS